MQVLLIDNGTSLLSKLQLLIPSTEITRRWDDLSDLDINSFNIIILSGSVEASVFWQHDLFKDEINIIKNGSIPVIGICFGCQLIAHAFGGTLKELDEKHKGKREVIVLDKEFSNKETISVFENHKWIIDKIPEDFKILAESSEGPEAIKHINKPIYGFQFHPEHLVDETEGDSIFLGLFNKLVENNI
jgi:GMP synthase-like glutamine amidotransferase